MPLPIVGLGSTLAGRLTGNLPGQFSAPNPPATAPVANQPVAPVPPTQAPSPSSSTAAPGNPETNPNAAPPTLPTVGALAPVFIVKDSTSNAVKQYPLSTEADYRTLVVELSVAATSGATAIPATDILTAVPAFNILDSNGYRVKLVPSRDFYSMYQRYSRYHDTLSTTELTGTASTQVTASATYEIPGCRLSRAQGPFTIEVTTASASGFSADCTALTVTYTISAIPGQTGGVSLNTISATLNPQPVASGVSDLSPTAPIQGKALDEFVLTGLTSNTADVSYWSIILNGTLVSNRADSGALVAMAQGRMNGTIPTGTMYLCFALGTQIAFNRSSHLWANYGSAPATTGVSALYVWYS